MVLDATLYKPKYVHLPLIIKVEARTEYYFPLGKWVHCHCITNSEMLSQRCVHNFVTPPINNQQVIFFVSQRVTHFHLRRLPKARRMGQVKK